MRLRLALLLALIVSAPLRAAETRETTGFSPNPGKLRMFAYVPDGLPANAPLVVALHGCTQGAHAFDDEGGWTELADRFGFALLLPEQQAANNDARCFNFFSTDHNRRGRGEAASIAAMIQAVQREHRTDPDRIFVTGLSAGAGMAAVMLAAYPELFQGGALIAGVPYGCASSPPYLAFQRAWTVFWYGEAAWASLLCGIDRTGGLPIAPLSRAPEAWRDLLDEASGRTGGRRPRVSLWQGSDDRTVDPKNLGELVKQWTAAHGIDQRADAEETTAAYHHGQYKDGQGEILVEAFELSGLGHAVPVDPGPGPAQCGKVAPYFVDRDICAAFLIARFWDLDRQR